MVVPPRRRSPQRVRLATGISCSGRLRGRIRDRTRFPGQARGWIVQRAFARHDCASCSIVATRKNVQTQQCRYATPEERASCPSPAPQGRPGRAVERKSSGAVDFSAPGSREERAGSRVSFSGRSCREPRTAERKRLASASVHESRPLQRDERPARSLRRRKMSKLKRPA